MKILFYILQFLVAPIFVCIFYFIISILGLNGVQDFLLSLGITKEAGSTIFLFSALFLAGLSGGIYLECLKKIKQYLDKTVSK